MNWIKRLGRVEEKETNSINQWNHSRLYRNIHLEGNARGHLGDNIQNVTFAFGSASQPTVNPSKKIDHNFDYVSPVGLCLGEAPYISSDLFVGRDGDMDKIHQILDLDRKPMDQRRMVIGGMGGIGKTQLAIAYAKRHRNAYESVLWFNATSEVTLKTSLQSMAAQIFKPSDPLVLDSEQILMQVKRWLSDTRNTRWLLIFDNYDEPESYDIQAYYPSASHGGIIVTTRLPDKVGGHRFKVQMLEDIDHGLQILATRSERKDVANDTYAQRLVEKLAGLPLALATAGAFLQKSTWSFEQYLQAYEQQWNVSQRPPLHLQEYQDRTLYTTWNLSYQRLEKENTTAAQMLKLLAYFDHQAIWYELFHAGVRENLPDWLLIVSNNATKFENFMQVMVSYCFLEVQSTTQTYGMHTCVHDWTLAELNQNIDPQSYWYAFDCVAESVEREEPEEDAFISLGLLKHARLTPHAMRLTHRKFQTVADQIPEPRLDRAEYIALLLKEQFQLEPANSMLLRILDGREKAQGPDHISMLNTVNNLGLLYQDQGKLEEAEAMLTRALAGREKALGADHISTLSTINSLGLLYQYQDKPEEAEAMYMRALDGYEKARGLDHPSTLPMVNNLGMLCWERGKLEKAEVMYMRALVGYEKALGPYHPSTLQTVNNLGLLYWKQGKLEEAEAMYARALHGFEKQVGPDHPSTLQTVNNLGILYRIQNKLEQAEAMYLRALAGNDKALGPYHTSTLDTVNNLGVLYCKQDKLEEAEAMFVRALDGCEKALGFDHRSTLDTVCNLGVLYESQSKAGQAEAMYVRAMAGREKALGAEHTSTLETVNHLAVLYEDQGRLEEAEAMYKRVLAGKEKALGSDHTSTLDTVSNLGQFYKNHGRSKEARKMFKRARKSGAS